MKATNIVDLAKNLYFDKPVPTNQKEFYVSLYTDLIEELREDLFYSYSDTDTFYIAGQSGTGKTTAMLFLPDEKLKKKYETIYIDYRNLMAFDDTDIIDVLLIFAFKMAESSEKIENKFYEDLKNFYKVHKGLLKGVVEKERQTSESLGGKGEVSVGGKFFRLLKARTQFIANFKTDKNVRKYTREIFELNKNNLLEFVNEIIDLWYEENGTERELLIIFDDFDKLRNIDNIKSIFIDNRYFFEAIKCRKIVSIPIHLASDQDFYNPNSINLKKFHLKLYQNPKTILTQDDKREINENRESLHRIINSRQEGGLIDADVIDKAIDMSGGILRQFVSLIYKATTNARRYESNKVTLSDLNKIIDKTQLDWSSTLTDASEIDLLWKVMENNEPYTDVNNGNQFIKTLLSLQILSYPNASIWYDVNPLLKKTVKSYRKQ